MTTEREYREWQSRNRKSRRKRFPNIASFLILALLTVSAMSVWKEHREEINLALNNLLKNYQGAESQQSQTNQIEVIAPTNPLNTQVRKKNLKPGATNTISNLNFTLIDKKAASLKYNGTSVTELASILDQHANTEAERARIIYTWIAYNIDYDVPAYLRGEYGDVSPKGVLESRKAVCSGYANLYKALANKMGLSAVVINGYAKGASYSVGDETTINHGWNGVRINKQWYLLDSTWGAGTTNNNKFKRDFNPFYFATPPDQFIYNHFPQEKKWQLLSQDYSKKQFDNAPQISSSFFKQGLKFISHNTHTIEASGSAEIILGADQDTIATSRLKQGSQVLDRSYTIVQKKNGKVIVRATFPAPGDYELEIFAKSKDKTGYYPHVLTYKVIAKGKGQEFPRTYAQFTEHNVDLQAPVQKYLPSHESINFKLKVPNAVEVQVIDKSSNKWTQLTAYSNDLFAGDAFVSSGKVHVVAQFPGDERYWSLVEYKAVDN